MPTVYHVWPASQKLLALVVVLLLAAFGAARAEAAGKVDVSFGEGGRLLLSSKLEEERATAVLPDGRIVVAGPRKMLALLPSGQLDSSFGDGGITPFLPPGSSSVSVNDLAVDSQGRLIVAGSAYFPESGFGSEALVARYGPNGRLDPSFGTNGFAHSNFGFPLAEPTGSGVVSAYSLALDESDRIVLTGRRQNGWEMAKGFFVASYEPYVARLTAEGEVDRSFAGSGALRLERLDWLGEPIPDAGGIYLHSFAPRQVLIRLQEDGAADPAFGVQGGRPLPQATEFLSDTLDDTSRLLLFGYLRGSRERGLTNGVLIKRLRPDGSLDRSFGRNGAASLRLPRLGTAVLAPGAGGAVFVAAEMAPRRRPGRAAAPPGMMLARLRPDGGLDRRFGRNGVVEIPFGQGMRTSVDTLSISGSKALIGGTWCARRCGQALARVNLGAG